jgi:hypothetical protein
MLTAAIVLSHLVLAFTLVNLDDELVRNIKDAMRSADPATDDEAATTLATMAATGKNYYITRKPDGIPAHFTVEDSAGKPRSFIYVNEIVDGEHRISLEDVTEPEAA